MNVPKLVLQCLSLPLLTSVVLASQEESTLPELSKKERKAIEKEIETYYQVKRMGWGPVKMRVEAPSIVLSVQAHGLRCETGGDGFYSSTVQDGKVIELAAQGAIFTALVSTKACRSELAYNETTRGTVDGDFVRVNQTMTFDSRAGSGRLIADASGSVPNPSSFTLFGDGVMDFGSCDVEFDYTEHWKRL